MIQIYAGGVKCALFVLLPLSVEVLLGQEADIARQPDQKWHRLVSVEGGFTVEMPSEPQKETQDNKTVAGIVQTTRYSLKLDGGNTWFNATFFDVSPDAPAATPEQRLDAVRDQLSAGGYVLKSETKVSMGTHPGRDWSHESKERSIRTRLFLVGNRFHRLTIYTNDKSTSTQADIKRFLDSLTLTDAAGKM